MKGMFQATSSNVATLKAEDSSQVGADVSCNNVSHNLSQSATGAGADALTVFLTIIGPLVFCTKSSKSI